MWWKYICRWNCWKYDYAWYITCKSLYRIQKTKLLKKIIQKIENTKDMFTKEKVTKEIINVAKEKITKD